MQSHVKRVAFLEKPTPLFKEMLPIGSSISFSHFSHLTPRHDGSLILDMPEVQ